MERIRLKCKYGSEIRSVLVPRNVQYIDLKKRLSQDFGFEVSLKYEDEEGDLILLTSQNDLNDLLEYTVNDGGTTINLQVYEQILPQLTRNPSKPNVLSSTSSTPTGASSTFSSTIGRNYLPTLDSHKTSINNEGSFPKWKKGEILGQGAFGVVYLGLNLNGELMAVKQLLTDEVSKKELNELKNEINLLKKLKHNNIVTYLGTELTSVSLSIFLEYVPGGSLKNLIDKFGPLEESIARIYTRQLCLGLEYLHRNGIAHRDIKGANCLVGNDGVIKLADFGSSKHWNTSGTSSLNNNSSFSSSNNSLLNSIRHSSITGTNNGADLKGTIAWMAPEIMRIYGGDSLGKNINSNSNSDGKISWRKADIWSLACTTLEMMTGKAPWQQFDNIVTIMFHLACQDTLPEFPSDASIDLTLFLTQCLQRDPNLRPEVTPLLLHPFVVSASPLSSSSSSTSLLSPHQIRPTTTMGIKNITPSTQILHHITDHPDSLDSRSNFPNIATPRSNHPSNSTSYLKNNTKTNINSNNNNTTPLMIDTEQIINNPHTLYGGDNRDRCDGEETPYTISNINDYPTISTQNKNNLQKGKTSSYDFEGETTYIRDYSLQNSQKSDKTKQSDKIDLINKRNIVTDKNLNNNNKLNVSEIELNDYDDDETSSNKLEIYSYSLENDEYLSDFTNMEDSNNLDDSILSKNDTILHSNIQQVGKNIDYDTQSVASNSSHGLNTKGRSRYKQLEPLENISSNNSVNSSSKEPTSSRSSSTTRKRKNRSNSFSSCGKPQQQTSSQNTRSISARNRESKSRDDSKVFLNNESRDEYEIKKTEFSPIIENDESNTPEGFKPNNDFSINNDDSLIIDYLNEENEKNDDENKKNQLVNKKKLKSFNSPTKNRVLSGSKSNINSISQLKNEIQLEQQELDMDINKAKGKKKSTSISQDSSTRKSKTIKSEDETPSLLSPCPSSTFLTPSSSSSFLVKSNNTKSKESLNFKKMSKRDLKKDDILDISCDSLDSILISGIHVSPRSSPRALNKKTNEKLRVVSEDEQNMESNLFSDLDLELDIDLKKDEKDDLEEKKRKKTTKNVEKIEKDLSETNKLVDDNDDFTEDERFSYDFSQKKPLLLEEHSGTITRLKLAKGGQFLISSSTDGTIRIWEANCSSSKCILDASSFLDNPSIEKNRPESVTDSKRNNENSEESTQLNSSFVTPSSNTLSNVQNSCPQSSIPININQNRIKVLNLWCDENLETVWGSSSDLSIRLWSGLEGRQVRLLRGHEDSITCLEGIDPNLSNSSNTISSSILIASGSIDRSVRIWDSRSKKGQAFVFRGHGDSVLTMKWMEGGRALVSAGKDKMIKIWDTRAGRLRSTMEKHFGSVHMLRVLQSDTSSEREREQVAFVSAGKDHMINFWTNSGDCIASHTAHRGSISYLSEVFYPSMINGGEKLGILPNSIWSNSLAHLLSIGNDNTIKLWDLKKCKNILEIPSSISLPPSTILSPLSNSTASNQNSMNSNPSLGTITRAVWTGPYGGFMTATSTGIIRTFDPYSNSNNDNTWKVQEIAGYGTNYNSISSPCSDLVSSSPYTHYKSENLIISACSTRNGKILTWSN